LASILFVTSLVVTAIFVCLVITTTITIFPLTFLTGSLGKDFTSAYSVKTVKTVQFFTPTSPVHKQQQQSLQPSNEFFLICHLVFVICVVQDKQ
jgi:hypothetical protein